MQLQIYLVFDANDISYILKKSNMSVYINACIESSIKNVYIP